MRIKGLRAPGERCQGGASRGIARVPDSASRCPEKAVIRSKTLSPGCGGSGLAEGGASTSRQRRVGAFEVQVITMMPLMVASSLMSLLEMAVRSENPYKRT